MSTKIKQTKQVIICRKDLDMGRGKLASQVAHAAMGVFTRSIEYSEYVSNSSYRVLGIYLKHKQSELLEIWLDSSFAKVVLKVNSEQELLEVYNKAKEKGILCSLITDNGKTEFNGVPTITCCAIGPDYNEVIDEITGKLPLY